MEVLDDEIEILDDVDAVPIKEEKENWRTLYAEKKKKVNNLL